MKNPGEVLRNTAGPAMHQDRFRSFLGTVHEMRAYLIDTFFRISIKHFPFTRWGDKFFCYGQFFRSHKRFPTNRMLLNDYLFRLKYSDNLLDPLRVYTSDKEYVKDYIRAKVGDEYNVPTVAVLKSKQSIQNFKFPPDCVIKPTHGSGRAIFRRNGEPIDINKIQSWMDIKYYKKGREINYKYLRPKIIVEPYVFGLGQEEDIKFFCYEGEPKVIRCSFDKSGENTRRFYTKDWNDLNISLGFPLSTKTMEEPHNFDRMLEVARKLSVDFSLVRIDMYYRNGRFYVGEITHCHGNAQERFVPPEGEQIVSALIFDQS